MATACLTKIQKYLLYTKVVRSNLLRMVLTIFSPVSEREDVLDGTEGDCIACLRIWDLWK